MKKITAIFLALMMLCVALLSGCGVSGEKDNNDKNNETPKVDYSQYTFTGQSWTREAEHDVETIRFGADGSFTYSCACGNPVNDADLCEGYTYDDQTKTITLNCIEVTEEMVTTIKIVECTETSLQLDFNGDIRTFTR